MKRMSVLAALAAALGLATPAWAHEDGLDARGIVVEVSANRIVLHTTDGETKSFAVSERTRIHRGKAPASIADVAKGEKAIVHAERSRAGDPVATSIKLTTTPRGRSRGHRDDAHRRPCRGPEGHRHPRGEPCPGEHQREVAG